MTEITVAQQAAEAVATDYPGLAQAGPRPWGGPLHNVLLENNWTARYTCGPYEVRDKVSPEPEHLSGDPEDDSLQREASAWAVLHTDHVEVSERGHLEWARTNPRPEVVFPAAYGALTADRTDPRFASGILVLVAAALDRARAATERVAEAAAAVAQEAQWEKERPEGTGRRAWLKEQHRAR